MSGKVVLEASQLKRHYEIRRGAFREPAILKALDGASFQLEKGKTLAVVGESGCGKSTLARLVTLIEEPTAGELKIHGVNLFMQSSLRCRICSYNIHPVNLQFPCSGLFDECHQPCKS